MTKEQFIEEMTAGYTHEGGALSYGAAMHDGDVCSGTLVELPLSMLNRHGLIA